MVFAAGPGGRGVRFCKRGYVPCKVGCGNSLEGQRPGLQATL